jgi:uncharacterized protein (TIGR03083 family)
VTDLADPTLVRRHLAALHSDRDRLGALAGTSLDHEVGSCPGWTSRDLLVHLGRVHRWAERAVAIAPGADLPGFGPGPGDRDPIEWVVEGLDGLIATFESIDLGTPCAAFAGPQSGAWWLRREAMETTVHRWDAQTAAGRTPDPVDGEVAQSGLDEWCELQSRRWFTPDVGLSMTLHLHGTDPVEAAEAGAGSEPEWFLEATPTGVRWEHGHRKGDVAVRASRSDLFLARWNRIDTGRLDVFGDRDLLGRFLAASAVG